MAYLARTKNSQCPSSSPPRFLEERTKRRRERERRKERQMKKKMKREKEGRTRVGVAVARGWGWQRLGDGVTDKVLWPS